MSDDKVSKSQDEKAESQSPRKPYSKPELKVYGAIERHTGGGSGTMSEGSMMRGSMRFPP